MPFELRVHGEDDIKRFGRKLKAAADSKALTKELRSKIRAAAKPALVEVRASIRSMPVHGARGGGGAARAAHQASRKRKVTSLRASIARAVSLKTVFSGRDTGVRFVIRKSVLPADQRSLPRHLDNPAGWRHPVFGTDRWVAQFGRPYWKTTFLKYHSAIRAAVREAVAATIDKLT